MEEDLDRERPSPSFFFGPSGLYTLAALIYSHIDNDGKKVREYVNKVLDYAKHFEDEDSDRIEDEILYGSAGYLYCLLLLRKNLGISYQEDIEHALAVTIEALIISGVSEKNDFLEYYFPKKRKTPYMGAAHGLIGIIYMMVKTMQAMPALQRDNDFVGLVRNTVTLILSKQTGFGSFPFKSSADVDEDDEPNHWCHGAPGAIPLLIEAFFTFKNQEYLDAALKSGKNVWRNGLLRKGCGLCHGTCGNAYALMSLYKATGDIIWKQRAQMFILWTGDKQIKYKIAQYPKMLSGMKVQGTPDTPYSLMEGSAGYITAYADFAGWTEFTPAKDLQIFFPGYEL